MRVNSMCEALQELERGLFLFVAINADSVNYLSMLDVLCEVSLIPVWEKKELFPESSVAMICIS